MLLKNMARKFDCMHFSVRVIFENSWLLRILGEQPSTSRTHGKASYHLKDS